MRGQELAGLETNYGSDDRRPLDDRFADALGLGLRHLRALREEVGSDLDESYHGIQWWTLPMKPRVLIGDYLLDCIQAIEINLIEAQLHHWELLDWWERKEAFIAQARVVPGARPPVQLPARLAPRDDLHEYMVTLHTAGLVRALGSALDCLAAAIIGVLPLPREIVRASFTRDLFKSLQALPASAPGLSAGPQLQASFRDAFMDELRNVGPEHWHEWIIGYRNMLVHRGRRMGMGMLVPRPGTPMRVGAEHTLPSEPELSQVEAWARWGDLLGCGQGSYVLAERAEETLRRALGAVARLASGACEQLLVVWRARRADPAMLPQPGEQWPKIPAVAPSGFAGFVPGSLPLSPDAMIGGASIQHRLCVAALDTASNHLWRTP